MRATLKGGKKPERSNDEDTMFATFISALLLILSFPKFSIWPLAWVAFVPIFHCLKRADHFFHTFLYAYLLGFLFFFTTWEWLRHVTYFGWIALVILYALYFGLFGPIAYWFLKRGHFFLSLFVLPSVWSVLEWIRTEIPAWGFGWNLLAYSQSYNLSVASLTRFVGVYGLSWLIVFANLTIFFLVDFILTRRKSEIPTFLFAVSVLALIFGFHFNHEARRTPSDSTKSIRLAVVQGNIPQKIKWDPRSKLSILETHEKLSRLVSYEEKPNLIIWPEAAFPGYLNTDRYQKRVLDLERELRIPILLGSPHLDLLQKERDIAYNSAYLVDHRLSFDARYDKVRLVSFGEYVPWRSFFGPLGLERFAYSLGVSDFVAGDDVKVFLLGKDHRFSVLICFEDTFPFLARRSIEKGADFLVVLTNDAWFGKSAAPHQHLEASIFRAIENGVPIVRAANTGVSAFIDARGQVLDRVKDKEGNDTFVAGVLARSISLGGEKTFYRMKGYQFPLYCLILIGAGFMLTLLRPTSSRSQL